MQEDAFSTDNARRRELLTSLAAEPRHTDQDLLEEALFDPDPMIAMLAHLGLRRLFPPTRTLEDAWRGLFGESVDLLARQACSGSHPLRLAALTSLAFAPIGLTAGLAERILASLNQELPPVTGSFSDRPPTVPLVTTGRSLELPEGMALLLAALPDAADRLTLFRRELNYSDGPHLLPILIALQARPLAGLVEPLVPIARSPDPELALAGARALLACGGNRVFLYVVSLLKETSDPRKLANLLPVLSRTGREEVWPLLKSHLKHPSAMVRKAAIGAVAEFAASELDRREALLPGLEDEQPAVVCEAAWRLWGLGSLQALDRLETCLGREQPRERALAAAALGNLPAAVSLPILADRLARERSGDVLRELMLAMRRLVTGASADSVLTDRILIALRRLLEGGDPFLRCQAAVLCGRFGNAAEDLILSALERQDHPHVIAALLAASGRTGMPRLLVLARFHDHPDPRVRSNLMEALVSCGSPAVPYLGAGLRDPSPRVRATAVAGLFTLGQIDVIGHLNRLLLSGAPLSILAACHALGRLMRLHPPTLPADHPLSLALGREARRRPGLRFGLPPLLQEPVVSAVFTELVPTRGEPEAAITVLERLRKEEPSSHCIRRLLAAFLVGTGRSERALPLLEAGLRDFPAVLADQLDAYRMALMSGDLPKAEQWGEQVRRTYPALLEACGESANACGPETATDFRRRLHHLSTPSMNLYTFMIGVKAQEGDRETVLELLAELLLARPTNPLVVRKLAELVQHGGDPLREALLGWGDALDAANRSSTGTDSR